MCCLATGAHVTWAVLTCINVLVDTLVVMPADKVTVHTWDGGFTYFRAIVSPGALWKDDRYSAIQCRVCHAQLCQVSAAVLSVHHMACLAPLQTVCTGAGRDCIGILNMTASSVLPALAADHWPPQRAVEFSTIAWT